MFVENMTKVLDTDCLSISTSVGDLSSSACEHLHRIQCVASSWHGDWLPPRAGQASLSIINSWSLLKLMSIELVMPSNHILCCPLLLPSIFPSIRVFFKEPVLHFDPLKFYQGEAGWENYVAVNIGYLSWKRKDESDGGGQPPRWDPQHSSSVICTEYHTEKVWPV